jgi:hypothetical protein
MLPGEPMPRSTTVVEIGLSAESVVLNAISAEQISSELPSVKEQHPCQIRS